MNESAEIIEAISRHTKDAFAARKPLSIIGGNSKAFYGNSCEGDAIDISALSGVTGYDPRELVITAHAGTTLLDLEKTLAENRQMLAFEPPRVNDRSTVGGTVACGLAGARRPYAGSVRDSVLGIKCINGRGEMLSFGGQVIKNVAGYDISRLMTGAMGTLGIITEVSFKVLPLPSTEITLRRECHVDQYLQACTELGKQPLPVSACSYHENMMYVRLSGNEKSVTAAMKRIPGEIMNSNDAVVFWEKLRDYRHSFFATDMPLWRLSVPGNTVPFQLDGEFLYDWGGAQRWLKSTESHRIIRELCASRGGHATLFMNGDNDIESFHPLAGGIHKLHQSLKKAFDPAGILNPGRLYKDI